MRFAIVDLETTGGKAQSEAITEVAVLISDGSTILEHFQTLLNPQMRITPFVQKLTGITPDIVQDAPIFSQIAELLFDKLQGCIFVAHNSKFDSSFLRESFRREGYVFEAEQMCTVQMSRKLLPGMASYSLGKLCDELGIQLENRHRAMGDALATTHLFHMMYTQNDWSKLTPFLKKPVAALPKGEIAKDLYGTPTGVGVAKILDADEKVLWVGSHKKLQKFLEKTLRKQSGWKKNAYSILCEPRETELLAKITELSWKQEYRPIGNRPAKHKSMVLTMATDEFWLEKTNSISVLYWVGPEEIKGYWIGVSSKVLEVIDSPQEYCHSLSWSPIWNAEIKNFKIKSYMEIIEKRK